MIELQQLITIMDNYEPIVLKNSFDEVIYHGVVYNLKFSERYNLLRKRILYLVESEDNQVVIVII